MSRPNPDDVLDFMRDAMRERPEPWRPGGWWSEALRGYSYFGEDAAYYAQWVSPGLVLYRANDDGRVVGVQVACDEDPRAEAPAD